MYRFLIVLSAALLLAACSKQVACDSEATQTKLLAESALSFSQRLQQEYELTFINELNIGKSLPVVIAQEEIFDNTDIQKLAQRQASELRFSSGRLVRKNYVAGELFCAGVLVTPNETKIPVSYEVKQGEEEPVSVVVRTI